LHDQPALSHRLDLHARIYDRVLPSRSVPTLVGLVVLAAGLYVAQGGLDLIRGRILGRIGTALDEAINARVFETVVRLPLMVGSRNEGLQPLRDLDNVRSFLGSMGPGAFFDLPWLPFYLAICFAFHWLIGVTALVGAVILVALENREMQAAHERRKRFRFVALCRVIRPAGLQAACRELPRADVLRERMAPDQSDILD
jgi:ABC-type protease/lipase transport system fused ATPase/permease subunit